MTPIENLAARYQSAPDWPTYLASTVKNHALWIAVDQHVELPGDRIERARTAAAGSGVRHLLVLSEDWCGDAVNIVPWVARLVSVLPGIDLRVMGRDDNPDVMDAHLTGESRSIPVVIFLDTAFREVGWWGPRPTALQTWFLGEGLELPKDERYREIRKWYTRDKGRSILDEITAAMAPRVTAA